MDIQKQQLPGRQAELPAKQALAAAEGWSCHG